MAKECLQSPEACLVLAHKTKGLDTRAVLLEFAYEFRTVAKRLERDERAASPIQGPASVPPDQTAKDLGPVAFSCKDDHSRFGRGRGKGTARRRALHGLGGKLS
jgi:hypothetical protein